MLAPTPIKPSCISPLLNSPSLKWTHSPIQPAVLHNGLAHCYNKLIRRHGRRQLQSEVEAAHCMPALNCFAQIIAEYIGWRWRNFFISAVFRLFVGQALRNVCCSDVRCHFLNKIADIFLNQLINFYSNNATNLHHLTTRTQYEVLTYKMAIALRPQLYVTSLHHMYNRADPINTVTDYQK